VNAVKFNIRDSPLIDIKVRCDPRIELAVHKSKVNFNGVLEYEAVR